MKKFSLLLLSLFSSLYIFGQNSYTVSGKVLDATGNPLPYANIVLHRSADSTMVAMNYSQDNGEFELSLEEANTYYLHITYIGYQDFSSENIVLNAEHPNHPFPSIELPLAGAYLNELVVVAKRPLLEVKPDKMVVNVAGSINATGNSALELLRKSPGVMVNQNDEISLLGKPGIQIYINGKKSPLNGEQLAQYLKTIPSEEIQKIELISQPSAKYDAEGNAGIINIVLKKSLKDGHNTTVSMGYAQGQEPNYNGHIQSNWKVDKVNAYGSLSYSNSRQPGDQYIYRSQNGMVFDQNFQTLNKGDGINYKAGIDYDINKNNVLGFMINGGKSDWDWQKTSRAAISSTPEMIDRILISNGGNLSQNDQMTYNLNYMRTGDNESVWSIDADYGNYDRNNQQNLPNIYWDGKEENILAENNYFIASGSDIEIYTVKSDFELPFREGKWAIGSKWSKVGTDNGFNFFNVESDQKIQDFEQSNIFNYNEEVFALYSSLSQTFDKWGLQAGLRLEHTTSAGLLTSIQQSPLNEVSKKYLDFFPSLGLTYSLSDQHIFQVNYSRRINRPNYKSLNPFEFKLDELTYEKGNPFLTPEYSHKVSLGYTLLQSITTSFSYSKTSDMISEVVELRDDQTAIQSYKNVASQQDFSWNISGSIPINDWWTTFTNVLLYHRNTTGELFTGQETSLLSNTFQVYNQQHFQLVKEFSLEVDGYYQSPSAWGGQFIVNEQWGVNLGIQKKILNDQGKIKLAVTDVFNSMRWKSYSDAGPYEVRSTGNWDSQQIKLSFSYLFGNQKIKSRKRESSNSKETNRID